MNDKLTDAQIIEAIERAFATEQDDTDAIRKVRQILAPAVPEEGLPDYNPETATEAENWSYDQGYETGWRERLNPATMDLDDVSEVLDACIATTSRIVAEQEAIKEARSRAHLLVQGAVIELPDEGPYDPRD